MKDKKIRMTTNLNTISEDEPDTIKWRLKKKNPVKDLKKSGTESNSMKINYWNVRSIQSYAKKSSMLWNNPD